MKTPWPGLLFVVMMTCAYTTISCRDEQVATSRTTESGHPIIGKLKTRNEEITIISSDKGPLYTVKDKSGKIVVKEAPESELESKLPAIHNDVKKQMAELGWAGGPDF